MSDDPQPNLVVYLDWIHTSFDEGTTDTDFNAIAQPFIANGFTVRSGGRNRYPRGVGGPAAETVSHLWAVMALNAQQDPLGTLEKLIVILTPGVFWAKARWHRFRSRFNKQHTIRGAIAASDTTRIANALVQLLNLLEDSDQSPFLHMSIAADHRVLEDDQDDKPRRRHGTYYDIELSTRDKHQAQHAIRKLRGSVVPFPAKYDPQISIWRLSYDPVDDRWDGIALTRRKWKRRLPLR